MSIQLASNIIPRNGNDYYLMEDIYLKGGLQIRDDATARDSINPSNLKEGMLVLTKNDRKLWILDADLATWEELQLGGGGGGAGSRQTVTQQVVIPANAEQNFTLALGKSALLLALSVDVPCYVKAFSTPARTDANPYVFLATADHLSDDGSTLLSDGSTNYNRRYAILANLEATPLANIYFVVGSTESTSITVNLSVTFLTLES